VPELWPFPVRQPIAQVLEWETEVLASREAEQRIAMRPAPRELLTYRHLLDAAGMAKAEMLVRAGSTGSWHLPIWSQASRPGIAVAASDTTLLLDTTLADYRGPGHAVVAADGGEAHLVEVAVVLSDRLELAAAAGVDIPDAIVAPARPAILIGSVEIERRRQGLGIVSAPFAVTDGTDLGASSFPSHAGLEVVTDPTVLRQRLDDVLGQAIEYVDNGSGPIAIEPERAHLQRRSTITLVDYGAQKRWKRLRWLHTLRGRQRAFWLPTWGRELVLQATVGAGDTGVAVAPVLADPAAWIGRHVMFDLGGGPVFREVTGATFDALGHRLSIAAPGQPIPADTQVHLLIRARLDSDRVELSHTATQTEMRAAVIEIP